MASFPAFATTPAARSGVDTWSTEDMERNVLHVQHSEELRSGGRKAHRLDIESA
ncbi:MAG TPA: hypothetical protein VIR61_05095 [Sulfuricaulis sp.]